MVEPIFRPRWRATFTASTAPGMKVAWSRALAAFIGVKIS
ncbi:Uncharacterised protein [Mycobacterium tuberculosis]|nr:Uncharacterised protein [Mycobacterium tuberculosis]